MSGKNNTEMSELPPWPDVVNPDTYSYGTRVWRDAALARTAVELARELLTECAIPCECRKCRVCRALIESEAAREKAVSEEREACAKIADLWAGYADADIRGCRQAQVSTYWALKERAETIADAIRARGKT